jgi:hypothetical protein
VPLSEGPVTSLGFDFDDPTDLLCFQLYSMRKTMELDVSYSKETYQREGIEFNDGSQIVYPYGVLTLGPAQEWINTMNRAIAALKSTKPQPSLKVLERRLSNC